MTLLFYSFISFLLIFFFYLNELYKEKFDNYLTLISFISLTIIASFRWGIGGDWVSYYALSEHNNIFKIFFWSPTFIILNYLSQKLSLGIYGVNLFLSTLLFYSFYKFSKLLHINILLILPLLFLSIYLNALMGYSRQSLSLSFIFLFLFEYKNKNFIKSLIFILLAIMSHISAAIFLPLILFKIKIKNNEHPILLVVIICFLCFFLFLAYKFYYLSFYFFIQQSTLYISKGVLFRIVPSLMIVSLFFYFHNRIIKKYSHLKEFIYYVVLLILFSALATFSTNLFSTAIDRINIYFFPLHSMIVSFAYDSFKKSNMHITFVTFVYLIYYSLFLGWFLLGDYSIYWNNYQFLLGDS